MKASDFAERKLSKGEEKEKERIVKGMKKAKASFKDRYGKDAEAVMYATATKLAKENVDKDGTPMCPDACCGVPVSECTCGPECKHCNCHFIKNESKDEYEPHMMYKGTKKDYKAKFPTKKKHHDSLMKRGYNHDDPETKKVEEYVFTKRDFLDNEAENLHSENAVELAKKFGTPKEIKQMDDILTRHMKRGHITPEDMETRDALVRKYYSMLEGDVPTQKGRDAKHNVLTPKAKNTVLKQIKKDANKQRRKMSKDAVSEDTEHDEVKVILNKHGITKLDDIELGTPAYEELFGYYMDSGEMPYGVMKARDGMPDEWIVDRISDLGLIEGKKEDDYEAKKKALQDIQADPNTAKDPELKKELIRRKAELEKLKEEMDWKLNESLMEGFEKEVMLVMKDNGISGFFNKGTLYVDGDLETVERAKDLLQMNFQYTDDVEVKQERDYYNEDQGLQGSVTPQTISKEFPGVADKNNLVQALLKMKRGDTNYSRNQMIAAADAFKELLSKDPMETQKLMMMLKRVKAKEEVASDINNKWKEYQK